MGSLTRADQPSQARVHLVFKIDASYMVASNLPYAQKYAPGPGKWSTLPWKQALREYMLHILPEVLREHCVERVLSWPR